MMTMTPKMMHTHAWSPANELVESVIWPYVRPDRREWLRPGHNVKLHGRLPSSQRWPRHARDHWIYDPYLARCARMDIRAEAAEVGLEGMRVLLGFERERNGSSAERMLDCRVGVSATVNDGLCRRLYIRPLRKPGPYPPTRQWNSDYGLPPASARRWVGARGKALRLLPILRTRQTRFSSLNEIARQNFPQILLLRLPRPISSYFSKHF